MCYAKHCFTKLGDIGWPWLGERLALSWSPFVPHWILFALVLHLKNFFPNLVIYLANQFSAAFSCRTSSLKMTAFMKRYIDEKM